jgi:signal transduction histidine kinase
MAGAYVEGCSRDRSGGMMTGPDSVGNVEGVSGSEQPVLSPPAPLLHRVTPRQLQIVDVVVASLVILRTVPQATNPGGVSRILMIVLGLLYATSVAARRRIPTTALLLATAAVVAGMSVGLNDSLLELCIAIPAFQVAAVYERRRSIPTGALAGATLLASAVVLLVVRNLDRSSHLPGILTPSFPALSVVALVAAWFVGDSVRVRRVYVAGLAEQAAQRQREAMERAQRSVAEERLQIARDLHDVVAHSLSVIAVQSGVGRHVIDDQPSEAKKALSAIETTSRAALVELRRMLGVLRRDDGLPAELAPAPGVAALDPLVDQVRAAGFAVNLDAAALSDRRLPATVELSIYRIVQEALTNVVKHAGPATVTVQVRNEPDALVLEIRDNGRGADAGAMSGSAASTAGSNGSGGHDGIVGMRERVAMFDGSLTAGPLTEGGFRVEARFPNGCLVSS